MKLICYKKMQILWLSLMAYIYLFCCRLWFENEYVSTIIKIPFLFVVLADIGILWNRRKEILKIISYYVNKNRALFFGIFLFTLYDVITLFYAVNISYSISKYRLFLRALFVAGSIWLCCYEDETDEIKKNIEYLIKSIGWILVIFVITTVIRWSLGLSPYLNRVSLRLDYNVYSIYLIFTLIIYIFYYIKWEEKFSKIFKILYIACGIAACDLLLLTSSRRAFLLCPGIVAVSFLSYFIKKIKLWKSVSEKKEFWSLQRIKTLGVVFGVIVIVAVNLSWAVPLFDRYVSSASEEKKNAHIDFLEQFMGDDISTAGFTEEGLSKASLSDRYSANVEKGLSSRQVIWNVAVSAIQKFTLKEKLFGRGSGYGWSLYEDENNEDVMEVLEVYYRMEKPKPQWMHPHNFFFTEFLEGGILKIICIIFLTAVLCVYLVQYIKKNMEYGMMLLLLYACLAVNVMLGSSYGLLGESLFWLATGLFVLMRSTEDFEKRQ